MTTTRETTTEQPDDLSIDPFVVIDQMLADDKIPDAARAQIEKAREAYCNAISTNRDVAECGFGVGLVIGAHVAGSDKNVLKYVEELLERLHQSKKGTKSGEVRRAATSDRVKEAALDILRKEPRVRSRADLGRKVADRLGNDAPTLKTIDRYLQALDKVGAMPTAERSKGKIS